MPKFRSGSAMMSPTRMRGLRLLNGSWNTTWTRWRNVRSCETGTLSMRSPSSLTSPAVGSVRRRIALPTVDLPQPLSPTSESVSPRLMSKLTPSTA